MDNIAIHTGVRPGESEEEHLMWHRKLVQHVLERLRASDLHLNPEKCVFEQKHLNFLGVRVRGGSVQMEQSKVNHIQNWIWPRNVWEVHKFLGFTGYYCYFIQGYSQIARPLLDLTKQATTWHWDDKQQEAFEELRDRIVKATAGLQIGCTHESWLSRTLHALMDQILPNKVILDYLMSD